MKKQPPQKGINEFWGNFTTKHPGKIFTILPDNLYAKRAAAHAPKGSIPGQNAVASYQEAAEACRNKVEKIVKECRRMNQKYRDPHFDIEFDFKRSQLVPGTPPDCLTALNEDTTTFHPMSVKRIEVTTPLAAVLHHTWLTSSVTHRTYSTDHSFLLKARPPMTYDRETTVTAGSCLLWQQ
jgi:hypothetical protein